LVGQPISARELCVSDESGAQTCITKAQLDTLLAKVMAEAPPQQPAIPMAATAPHLESAAIATVESQEPEHTRTVTIAISGAALVWYPEVEAPARQRHRGKYSKKSENPRRFCECNPAPAGLIFARRVALPPMHVDAGKSTRRKSA